jgi:16S rRNA pseudouridine516 synthase
MTLEQLLFSQGFGTRKGCRLLVADGAVEIDGVVMDDPAATIDVTATVPTMFRVAGEAWEYHAKAYLMLNKPSGFECSQKAKSHPSVYTLLPSPLRTRDVQSVGRLDQDTTGLLLFSDDGQFIHRMASPKHKVAKVYEVTTSEDITPTQIERLLAGVVLEDSPETVTALACRQVSVRHMQLTLTSGKYHQVKRMLAAVGNHVAALSRSQIGALSLPNDLAVGDWRWLTPAQLAAASETLGRE